MFFLPDITMLQLPMSFKRLMDVLEAVRRVNQAPRVVHRRRILQVLNLHAIQKQCQWEIRLSILYVPGLAISKVHYLTNDLAHRLAYSVLSVIVICKKGQQHTSAKWASITIFPVFYWPNTFLLTQLITCRCIVLLRQSVHKFVFFSRPRDGPNSFLLIFGE